MREGEALVRLAEDRARIGVGNDEDIYVARASLGTYNDALRQIEGAYSLVALSETAVIGVRDPFGVRPLVLGRIGGSPILTSETCALDIIGAEFVRDVEPGEIVLIDQNGLRSIKPFPPKRQLQCVFEYVYFARPDTSLWGQNVYQARKALGHRLAEEHPAEADIVIPVPTRGSGPRSASPSGRASRSRWGSSGTTTWAAPSSSRVRASVISASGSS